MKRYFFAFLLLTACVTADDGEGWLQSWLGADADALVMAWGAPMGQYSWTYPSDGSIGTLEVV